MPKVLRLFILSVADNVTKFNDNKMVSFKGAEVDLEQKKVIVK